MRFSWDPEKSEANLRERGFDFAFATLVFDGPTLERELAEGLWRAPLPRDRPGPVTRTDGVFHRSCAARPRLGKSHHLRPPEQPPGTQSVQEGPRRPLRCPLEGGPI